MLILSLPVKNKDGRSSARDYADANGGNSYWLPLQGSRRIQRDVVDRRGNTVAMTGPEKSMKRRAFLKITVDASDGCLGRSMSRSGAQAEHCSLTLDNQ